MQQRQVYFFCFSGYIPKGEHYFGKPYADTCLSAIASFQEDQVKHHRKIRDLRTIAELQRGKEVPQERLSDKTLITTKYKTPLKSITVRPKGYFSPQAPQHSLSPFIMSNDDPKKFLMSGYTGFVPLARGEMGMGYPLLTNKALCEFTNESERLKRVKDLPVTVVRPEIKIVDTKPIYVKDSGQVPHYTGHVPGNVLTPQSFERGKFAAGLALRFQSSRNLFLCFLVVRRSLTEKLKLLLVRFK